MQEARDPVRDVADAVWDGLRQIGDFSYAILPKDVAHAWRDFKKAVLNQIRVAGRLGDSVDRRARRRRRSNERRVARKVKRQLTHLGPAA